MKNWLTKLVGLWLLLFVFSACEKDETRVVMTQGAAPQLTASSTTASLVQANAASNAVTYTWTAADFGYQAAVGYVLQFARQGTNFANPMEFNMGAELSKTFTVGELNGLYMSFDCNAAGVNARLDVRVKATLTDAMPPVLSNVTTIQATPYQAQQLPSERWAIIGSATANGWGTETPMNYDFCTRTWTITLPLTAAEFKFRANNSWDKNLGDEGTGDAMTTGRKLVYNVAPTPNPPNIALPAAGTYTVTLDVNATPNPIFTLRR
ncbi:SusE domain-containing protein [Hymenobacter koreensis]|uniref:SusE outer membrane protein domain-containing protein n=1 Tax=Hymenobacter koreensis TaxID=1084523 RepID=A0ABP8IYB8_9BACT